MEATLIVLLIAFPLVGALVRQWYALVVPLVAWPLFYLGLGQSWWGTGLGDGWQYAAAALTTVGFVSTALHVAAARRVRSRSSNGGEHFA